MTTPVRYIRDTLNRCDVTFNRFLEIQAMNAAGVNVALNKPVIANFADETSLGLYRVTDGEYGNTNAFCGTNTVTPAYVVVDLGSVLDIASITFWHYYGYAAVYSGVQHEISTDGVNWTVIFDSDVNGAYPESGTGHVMTAPLNAIVSPFPSGVVTSQPPPNGQSLTISFSTTNSPTSGMASLNPDQTNPSGAVSTLGTIEFGTNTGTATFSNIPPGNYVPTITLTNAAGTRSVSGAQPVAIVGISGNPTAGSSGTAPAPAPTPPPSTATPVTSVTISPLTATGSQQFTATVS